jgi:hypothetical protein
MAEAAVVLEWDMYEHNAVLLLFEFL